MNMTNLLTKPRLCIPFFSLERSLSSLNTISSTQCSPFSICYLNIQITYLIRRLFLSASFSKDAGNAGFPTCCLKKDADNHFMSAHKSWQVHPHHPATSVPAELPVHRRCLFPWLLSFAPMKGWHNGLLWFQLKNAPALWISG